MKNILSNVSLSLLTTFCVLSLEAKVHENQFKEKKAVHCKEKECRDCDFVITAKDIGCEGVVLCKSGYYCLGEDAVFNPKPNKKAAIRIKSSNVTLDLRGRTLSQKTKELLDVDGIVVDPGLTNIIIKNGTVRDFSDAGIRAGAVSPAPLVTELSISDIRSFNNGNQTSVANATINGDAFGGVVIINAQDTKISNCDFNENFLTGLWAFNMTKLTMENCHCDDNTSAHLFNSIDQTAYGASVSGFSADVAITKCTFNRNSSSGFGAAFNSGFAALASATTNIIFDSCQFNDTTVMISVPEVALFFGSTEACGIEMINATNATFNNCEANGSTLILSTPLTEYSPTLTNNINEIFGFDILYSNNVKITNCSSSGLTFQNNSGVAVRGFIQSFELGIVQQLYISNCHSYANTNVYDGLSAPASQFLAEGFDLYAVANVVIEDCTSCGHNQKAGIAPEGQFSYTAGFKVDTADCPPCGTVVFRRCVANGNTDTGNLGGYAFGFSTRDPLSAGTPGAPNSGPYVFESCIAENNTAGSGTGYGFDILNLTDSEILNCIANGNNVGINVSDFTAPVVGSTTFGSADNIFRGNVVSSNTAFGIRDSSAAKNNAYYANQARNNGTTGSSATANFSGAGVFPVVPKPSCTSLCFPPAIPITPVLFWSPPLAPCTLNSNCVVSTPLDNISITN